MTKCTVNLQKPLKNYVDKDYVSHQWISILCYQRLFFLFLTFDNVRNSKTGYCISAGYFSVNFFGVNRLMLGR